MTIEKSLSELKEYESMKNWLIKSLPKQETYTERVEIRKEIKEIDQKIKEKLKC